MDIDIIGLSETSQHENEYFLTNIDINGYQKPYCTGSKISKGGVAIYAKSNLKTWERDDLKIVDKNLEGVWCEIKNEKSKNIVCGCLYRHPNTDIDEFTSYISKCLTKIAKEKK